MPYKPTEKKHIESASQSKSTMKVIPSTFLTFRDSQVSCPVHGHDRTSPCKYSNLLSLRDRVRANDGVVQRLFPLVRTAIPFPKP